MYASLQITDAAAVLQGIPLVSAMSLAYVQLACVLAATQGGRRIHNLFNNRVLDHADNFRAGGQWPFCCSEFQQQKGHRAQGAVVASTLPEPAVLLAWFWNRCHDNGV